jgi:polyphosphate kinase 2 (PPK2 family)
MLILCILGMKIFSRTLLVNAPWSIIPSDHRRILQVIHKWMLFIHTSKEKELYILC